MSTLLTLLLLILLCAIIYHVYLYLSDRKTMSENFGNVESKLSSQTDKMHAYKSSRDPYDNNFYGNKGYLNPMDKRQHMENN